VLNDRRTDASSPAVFEQGDASRVVSLFQDAEADDTPVFRRDYHLGIAEVGIRVMPTQILCDVNQVAGCCMPDGDNFPGNTRYSRLSWIRH
jgi:hypothetical protein